MTYFITNPFNLVYGVFSIPCCHQKELFWQTLYVPFPIHSLFLMAVFDIFDIFNNFGDDFLAMFFFSSQHYYLPPMLFQQVFFIVDIWQRFISHQSFPGNTVYRDGFLMNIVLYLCLSIYNFFASTFFPWVSSFQPSFLEVTLVFVVNVCCVMTIFALKPLSCHLSIFACQY